MIDLPDHPTPVTATPALVDFGAFLTPALGGPIQRVERMGSRFRISVSMPPLPNVETGRQWVARLVRGKQEGVRMEWPLLGFDPGTPGAIKVNGSSQTGRTLNVDGGTPNYVAREGQFFSLETAGQHFLYMVSGQTVFSATGTAALPIEPMLRRSPTDNDLCHFGRPMVEGFIMGDEFAWEMALADFVALSFDILEIE
jgi:hypothetical protein